MTQQFSILCPPCGAIIVADTEEEVVEKALDHAADRHGSRLTREDVLAAVRRPSEARLNAE
jgi:predicted small metal-binding protein